MEKTIGDKIRIARIVRGLSQENVADAIGMSTGNYGKIERGEINVSVKHLVSIAKVFQMPVSQLYEDSQTMESVPNYSSQNATDLNSVIKDVDELKAGLARVLRYLNI